MFLLIFSVISSVLIVCAYLWHRKMELFFIQNNVPFVPSSFFGGSLRDVLLNRASMAQIMLMLYKEATKRDVPCIGARFLNKNCLIIRDPELIKKVLVQDFNHFSNRSASGEAHRDPLGGYNLFLVKNPMWHEMRSKITPVFTTSRMRMFFDEVNGMGEKLSNKLMHEISDKKEMSLKDLNGAFAIDVYASCSFGIEVNFLDDPKSLFGNIALEMFNFKTGRALEFATHFLMPELTKVMPLFFFSKDGSTFLKNMLSKVLSERQFRGISRNDLMDVIVKIKRAQENGTGSSSTHFNDEMLLAQSVIFFVAGFETTSTALTHTLFELAKNPEVQSKLKNEISTHFETHGQLTYDNISELKYLTMVCQEIFRLYPAFSFLNRECTPDHGKTSYSLQPHFDFDVPAGFPVYIPTYALHYDEKYFPNAYQFDPERFRCESDIPKACFLPFGLGPRNCLAKRLAYMVMKIGIINVLRQFSIEKCDRTPENIHPKNLVILVVPDKKIYVRLCRDSGKK